MSMLCLHVLDICACVVYFFILVTCRECPHSSLCCVCFVKHHLLLSFPKVLSKIRVVCPIAFFFPFPPILLDSLSPLWGLRLSAVRGVMHMDENSHLLLTLLGRDRGEIMTGKEMRTTRIPVLQFLGHFIGPVLLLLLFTWGSETAPQKGGAVEFGNGSVGMAGNMDSWISPLFV